ncbi:MAG: hypothetical protein HY207_04065 [Nitrospirae bacterium]|nr:hypothetical protein [Nitrospirota bacterium]
MSRRLLLNRPLLGWSLFIAVASGPAMSRAENFTVPGSAATLQGAIDLAKANTSTGDTITVASGTYGGNLTIGEALTIEAEDGAKVVLQGSSAEPLIQINAPGVAVTLHRLILSTAGPAIVVNGGVVNLRNLVITQASKAIDCQNTSGEIVQVTFYRIVGDGIACNGSTMTIRNNIFAIVSGTPINLLATPIGATALTSYNLFFQVPDPAPGEQRGNPVVDEADPAFVDPDHLDFHLTSGSPAIDTGDPSITDRVDDSRSDLGAYGGPSPGAHSRPFQTAGVKVACDPSPGTSCQVSWTANADYAVSGYRVSFSAPSAPVGGVYDGTATEGASPQSYLKADVCSAGTTCAGPLTGLSDSITAPDQPTGLTAGIGDTRLKLSWNSVASATSYEVYSGTTPGGGSLVAYGLTEPRYTLQNLTNGTTYYVSVRAVSQPILSAIVNTLYGADVAATTKVSAPSDQSTGTYGTAQFSVLSSEVAEAPQLVVGFPPLEDTGGCFIATAAYGSALAPQVEVLRVWRDRYLSTHAPGRAFVAAYRVWSPPVAARLRRSEALRSLVRILLLPAVGFAWFWIEWPWMAGACALAGIAMVSRACWRRRDPPRA